MGGNPAERQAGTEKPEMKFYAWNHGGNQCFTTMNGSPLSRAFAFNTKKERDEAIKKIQDRRHFAEPATRREVEGKFGRDFWVVDGRVYTARDGEDMENMFPEREQRVDFYQF